MSTTTETFKIIRTEFDYAIRNGIYELIESITENLKLVTYWSASGRTKKILVTIED